MTIHHHPNDATLMAYVAGSLPENQNFVVATHLSLCARCREQVREMEQIGAQELDSLPGCEMADDAFAQVMAQLDGAVMDDKPAPANDFNAAKSVLPAPLRDYLPSNLEDLNWKSMAPGIKSFTLAQINAGNGSLRLLKIAPGITIPEHTHTGNELTLVLKGSFSDEIGRFKAGDMADLDEDNQHQPIADTDEPCICLIATEGPLRFKSVMPKIMQYFVGM